MWQKRITFEVIEGFSFDYLTQEVFLSFVSELTPELKAEFQRLISEATPDVKGFDLGTEKIEEVYV